jgi:hypothetical protein
MDKKLNIFLIKNCNLQYSIKDIQATEEAFSLQTSNFKKHEIFQIFLFLWLIFALLDPDPDSESGSG